MEETELQLLGTVKFGHLLRREHEQLITASFTHHACLLEWFTCGFKGEKRKEVERNSYVHNTGSTRIKFALNTFENIIQWSAIWMYTVVLFPLLIFYASAHSLPPFSQQDLECLAATLSAISWNQLIKLQTHWLKLKPLRKNKMFNLLVQI